MSADVIPFPSPPGPDPLELLTRLAYALQVDEDVRRAVEQLGVDAVALRDAWLDLPPARETPDGIATSELFECCLGALGDAQQQLKDALGGDLTLSTYGGDL